MIEIPVSLLALSPAIIVLFQIVKAFIPERKKKFIPLISALIGVVVVGSFEGFTAINVIFGAMIGFSATGLYELKNVTK